MRYKSNGIVIGIINDLEDELGLGRVQVQYPHLDGTKSAWARIVTPMAGGDRGLFFRHEVGDEVLVGFEQSDPRRPCVLGGVWSDVDKPPADDGDARRNNWRFIRSRSGHILKFDDTDGGERIELIDKDGKRRLVVDSAGSQIELKAEAGSISIVADADNVAIEAPSATLQAKAKNIEVEASSKVSVNAPQVEIKSKGNMTLEAVGILTLKGSVVKIN